MFYYVPINKVDYVVIKPHETLCTFTFSLQTFTIFFLINAFINVYYNFF